MSEANTLTESGREQMPLRLPAALKLALKERADRRGISMNAQACIDIEAACVAEAAQVAGVDG